VLVKIAFPAALRRQTSLGSHCALWLHSLLFDRRDQIKGIINKIQ